MQYVKRGYVLTKIIHIITVLCFFIAICLILINVITRYVVMDGLLALANYSELFDSIYYSIYTRIIDVSGLADEIPGFMLIWISALGALMVHMDDQHIAFNGVKIPKYTHVLYTIGRLLMVCFFVVMTYQSIRMIRVGGDSLLETIDIPIGYFMVIVPIFGGVMTLITIKHILKQYGKI